MSIPVEPPRPAKTRPSLKIFRACLYLPPVLMLADWMAFMLVTGGNDAAIWRLILHVHGWLTMMGWPLLIVLFGALAWAQRGRPAPPGPLLP